MTMLDLKEIEGLTVTLETLVVEIESLDKDECLTRLTCISRTKNPDYFPFRSSIFSAFVLQTTREKYKDVLKKSKYKQVPIVVTLSLDDDGNKDGCHAWLVDAVLKENTP